MHSERACGNGSRVRRWANPMVISSLSPGPRPPTPRLGARAPKRYRPDARNIRSHKPAPQYTLHTVLVLHFLLARHHHVCFLRGFASQGTQARHAPVRSKDSCQAKGRCTPCNTFKLICLSVYVRRPGRGVAVNAKGGSKGGGGGKGGGKSAGGGGSKVSCPSCLAAVNDGGTIAPRRVLIAIAAPTSVRRSCLTSGHSAVRHGGRCLVTVPCWCLTARPTSEGCR